MIPEQTEMTRHIPDTREQSNPPPHTFAGFTEGVTVSACLPDPVYTELIPQIDDLDELKVTLLVLWRLAQMRADVAPWTTEEELLRDTKLRAALGNTVEASLRRALARAVRRGTLLQETWERGEGALITGYFANGPRSRAAVAAIRRGQSPERAELPERPNIFTLYEQTVGPLTPLLVDELREAEDTYPETWIEDAFREAARQNKRNWKYILAILERWWSEGKDEVNRRTRQRDPHSYIEGKYGHLIQH